MSSWAGGRRVQSSTVSFVAEFGSAQSHVTLEYCEGGGRASSSARLLGHRGRRHCSRGRRIGRGVFSHASQRTSAVTNFIAFQLFEPERSGSVFLLVPPEWSPMTSSPLRSPDTLSYAHALVFATNGLKKKAYLSLRFVAK